MTKKRFTVAVYDENAINGFTVLHDHYIQRKQLMIDSGVKILNDVYDFMNLVERMRDAKT